MGTGRAFVQSDKASLVESPNSVADGLGVAAQVVGNLRGLFPSGAGQENLATAQDEGIGRAQTRLQLLALGVGYGTHKNGSFHNPEDNT
jgi:hypothetical protein